ncbi:hypothetical protein RA2_03114 [Roseovarius sp. A-2]|uniref:hypothetical protein n=1 Tax=Roseovarius sp. A-2 TaxID=1570360 RepID=UPI0009B571B7|nr:hypothetical protein [Roseovarius sp. A-2]GAW36046.1 hypothetical protein RA2_03114 [Roseovarius sp. A-2]
MSLIRILDALEDSPTVGTQAQVAARMGFLEWVFATPGPVTAQMVREALADPAAREAQSAAARAFVEYLEEACISGLGSPARRGRARMVH